VDHPMVHMDRLGHSLGADVHIELHLTTPRLRLGCIDGTDLCTSKCTLSAILTTC